MALCHTGSPLAARDPATREQRSEICDPRTANKLSSSLSMLTRFLALVAAAPEARALIDAATVEITTRAALRTRSETLAAELTAAGVREGDAVAIQLPNSAGFVAAFLAILKLRAIAVPIDRDAPESEVGMI